MVLTQMFGSPNQKLFAIVFNFVFNLTIMYSIIVSFEINNLS